MFVITVKFVIHEKDIDKFKTRILQQARDSLELEKDCHEFDVCHDPNDQNVVFLYETYTDKDAFDIHLQSDHYLAFNEEVTPWVREKIVTELEKDCHEFDVCHDPNDKNVVFLYETYTDKDAFDIHLQSNHYLAFNEEVTPWVKEKIVTQLEKQKL